MQHSNITWTERILTVNSVRKLASYFILLIDLLGIFIVSRFDHANSYHYLRALSLEIEINFLAIPIYLTIAKNIVLIILFWQDDPFSIKTLVLDSTEISSLTKVNSVDEIFTHPGTVYEQRQTFSKPTQIYFSLFVSEIWCIICKPHKTYGFRVGEHLIRKNNVGISTMYTPVIKINSRIYMKNVLNGSTKSENSGNS